MKLNVREQKIMKMGNVITTLIVTISLLLFSQAATAATNASILYDETALDNGYWQYDYTFANLSTNNEYLYGVQLYFGDLYEVSDTHTGGAWGGSWGMANATFFLETHSSNYADDIATGNSLSGFSFTTKNQLVGNISYSAFFDEHNGNRTYTSGTTAAGTFNGTPVVPEPVSTVLFLTGGATMAFRYRQKRKRQSG
jgi:hypothetical protein